VLHHTACNAVRHDINLFQLPPGRTENSGLAVTLQGVGESGAQPTVTHFGFGSIIKNIIKLDSTFFFLHKQHTHLCYK